MNYIQQYPWLVSLPWLMFIAFLGMLTNFFKKKIKGETITDIRNYFRDNVKSTIAAFIATEISAFGMISSIGTGQTLDIVAVFLVGYMMDSTFNKWDKVSQ